MAEQADNGATPGGSASPGTAADKAARVRAEQDRAMADDIVEAGKLIRRAQGSPEILAVLATKNNYTPAKLAAGLGLQAEADAAFQARQAADARAAQAKRVRDALLARVLAAYTEYRLTVQTNYTGAARKTLGAAGRVSHDIDKLILELPAAYGAAQQEPYAATLAEDGFTAERLAAAIAEVDQLKDAHGAYRADEASAVATTAMRDEKAAALSAWIGKFRKLAKQSLKSQPALLATLAA